MTPAHHSEECRARIVRHMTADDDLSPRVQISQQSIVKTAPSEAHAGERDSAPELARKKVRFAERVEEQTAEGTVTTIPQSSSSSSSSPTTIDTDSYLDKIVSNDGKEREAVKKDLLKIGENTGMAADKSQKQK